jgi:hypothetical protein
MSNIIDKRNKRLAMEVLAFHEYRRSRQLFAVARAGVDKIERETRELQASAFWAGKESSLEDLIERRRAKFCTTPLFYSALPHIGEYRACMKCLSVPNKPSLSSSGEQSAT